MEFTAKEFKILKQETLNRKEMSLFQQLSDREKIQQDGVNGLVEIPDTYAKGILDFLTEKNQNEFLEPMKKFLAVQVIKNLCETVAE